MNLNPFKPTDASAMADEYAAIEAAYEASVSSLSERVKSRKEDVASRLAELEREQRALNNLGANLPV